MPTSILDRNWLRLGLELRGRGKWDRRWVHLRGDQVRLYQRQYSEGVVCPGLMLHRVLISEPARAVPANQLRDRLLTRTQQCLFMLTIAD